MLGKKKTKTKPIKAYKAEEKKQIKVRIPKKLVKQ